jgi:hypothetical protein
MATYAEPYRPYEFALSDSGTRSYEDITLASGAGALVAGSVIGRVSKRQAAAPIPTIVGTGTGLMSGLTFGPDVQVGSYVITLTQTSATAAFTVVAPDGTALPNGAVATAYKSNHLSFLIANGGTMTTGDVFTVVVTAGGTPVLVGTGSGTVSGVTLGKYAQLGTYKVRVLATSATGAFEVLAPDGSSVGEGNIATAFASDHVNFTLANGGTMTLGDYFNIIVAGYTTPQGKLWDPTSVDGTNEVYGVITHDADASSTTATVSVLTRDAEVKSAALQWKSTVTAAQKSEAYRQLAANGVQVRS